MLYLNEVRKTFNAGTINEKKALCGVNLHLNPGDFVTIIGGNGAGKSTTLNAVAGVWPIDSGEIIIDGKNISGMDPDTVRKTILGTEIAYIPQAAMNALNPTMKIIRFIEDVIHVHDPKAPKGQIREQAEKQVKLRLALEYVVKVDKISVSDEDLEAEFVKFAEQYGMEVEQVKAAIPATELAKDIAVEKAMKFIRSKATITTEGESAE